MMNNSHWKNIEETSNIIQTELNKNQNDSSQVYKSSSGLTDPQKHNKSFNNHSPVNYNSATLKDKFELQNRSSKMRNLFRRDSNSAHSNKKEKCSSGTSDVYLKSPQNWRDREKLSHEFMNNQFSVGSSLNTATARSMATSRRLTLEEYKSKKKNDGQPTPNRTKPRWTDSHSSRNEIPKEYESIPALDISSVNSSCISDATSIFSLKNTHNNEKGREETGRPEEPEIFTLSSDEEEKEDGDSYRTLCEKEPTLASFDMEYSLSEQLKENIANDMCSLKVRVIRIGSYKYLPSHSEDTLLMGSSFRMSVKSFDGSVIAIIIPLNEIVRALVCFYREEPLLFIYVKSELAFQIRSKLGMKTSSRFYFDPLSKDQSQRRITLIIKRIGINTKNSLLKLATEQRGQFKLLEEIGISEAETILLQSTPSNIRNLVKTSEKSTPASQTILIYPPPPSKGAITISKDDYLCLAEECFINDVIIDFYLKWLLLSKLSEIHRQRTHVFSTFFYKRLTFKPKSTRRSTSFEETKHLSNAERRHARVKSWSKGVDIFEKDFIIVPINEKSHWFLAVICFPGLEAPGPPPSDSIHSMEKRPRRKRSKPQPPIITDLEWSDRDEAEGDEDELEDIDNDFEPASKKPKEEAIPSITPEEPIPSILKKNSFKKWPCILIFDSLAGSQRSKIVATLREYLTIEHEKKKGSKRLFTRDSMPGACPKVPQQMNYSDCGIYTLQYAESFFEKPIKDYSLPIRSLVDWFETDIVLRKRESISKLIQGLMNKEQSVELPDLTKNDNQEFETKVNDESPLSSPRRNSAFNSPAQASQETSMNMEINEFKPIPDMQPFEGKKINFTLSNKTVKKSLSTEKILSASSPSPERQEEKQFLVVPSISKETLGIEESGDYSDDSPSKLSDQCKNNLQNLADIYSYSDSDDELFISNKDSKGLTEKESLGGVSGSNIETEIDVEQRESNSSPNEFINSSRFESKRKLDEVS